MFFRVQRRAVLAWPILAIAVLTAACGSSSDDPDPTATLESTPIATLAAADTTTPTVPLTDASPTVAIPTTVSVSESIEFPTATTTYPEEWPEELQYPGEFVVLSATDSQLPADSGQGWLAQHRFVGDIAAARDVLSEHFSGLGWTIEALDIPSGDILLIFESPGNDASGTVIIGPDPSNSDLSNVLTTVRIDENG